MKTKMTNIAAAAALGAAAVATLASAPAALAATSTDTFGVSATVEADCVITSAGSLAFGTVGALTAAVDGQSTISVKCTDTTTYNVGLNAGTTSGTTVTDRKMIGAGTTPANLSYALYSDSARSTNWGNTVGTDTVAGTGTGSAIDHVVYGRIPVQTAVKPDSYSDTITITVTY